MSKWFLGLRANKQNFGFICTITCLFGLLALAFFKGVDVSASLPVVLGTYLGSRAVEKSTAFAMASKDPKCDTRAVINDLEYGVDKGE